MAEHGFDLTHFGDAWPLLMAAADLHYVGRCRDGRAFEWASEGGTTVVTQNNPSTGEYGPGREMRDDDPGFASYIGMTGPTDDVVKLASLVRQYADDVKDESPGKRHFI